MKFSLRTILPILIISFTGVSSLLANDKVLNKSVQKKIIRDIYKFQKRHRLTSLSFSIFRGHHEKFSFAVGYADANRKIRATPEHIYTLASVTKCITGVVIVELVSRNVLSLSDSVYKYIAGFPKEITVLDLLNHTSGFIRENENEHYLTGSSYQNVVDYLPRRYKRRKKHRYANINYAALGALIEKLTKNPFKNVANYYFKIKTGDDLYFSNHTANSDNPLFTKNYVRRYRKQYLHKPVNFGLWEPAAFAQASSKSLAKFLRHYMTPDFISFLSSHAAVIKTRTYYSGKKVKDCYAFGFRLRFVNNELKYVYHNGFIYGVLSTFYYFPQKDVGFVALSNMSSYPKRTLTLSGVYKIIEKIMDAELKDEVAEQTVRETQQRGLARQHTHIEHIKRPPSIEAQADENLNQQPQ
ncbi:MAG: serine hydrolase domain-containing protein [bacterium]